MTKQNSTAPSTSDERAHGLVHPVDLAVSAIILVGVGYLFYETTQFDEVSPLFAQNIQPAMYPQLLLWIIAGLTCLMPFEHILLTKKGKDIDKDRSESVHPLTKMTIAFLIAVVLASPYLGMLLTMVTICLVMPRLWGYRKLTPILLFAGIFPVVVSLVFSKVLKVYFDSGIFGIAI
ncbi:MAG: tripartite tricarboxylate transporter TctB family protein [Pelagibacteraceae bacterium]|jgi:putative tricarboxylic transport membrane protein